mgnify:CR=1 FL=1
MSSKTVKTAINAFLQSSWTDTPIKEVENIYVDQPRDADWIAVQYPGAYQNVIAISNRCWREEGTFILSLVGVSGEGTDALDTIGEDIMNLFRGENINGVNIRGMSTPTYAFDESRQESDSGNAYRYLITVDYYYDLPST